MKRVGYAHSLVKMLRVTKTRVLVVAWVAAGASLGVGGCAVSPIVGDEAGSGGSTSSDGGARRGTPDLFGSVSSFTSLFLVNPVEGACVPRPLPIASDGSVACAVYSAHLVADSTECACNEPWRRPAPEAARRLFEPELVANSMCGGTTGIDCADFCLCETVPATGESADSCLEDLVPSPSSGGWCYVDPENGRGSTDLVANCPASMRRLVRVLPDESNPDDGTSYLIACSGGPLTNGSSTPGPGAVGSPCLPDEERHPGSSGFTLDAVYAEFGAADCHSNICLINHVQGRVSCPYGQTSEQATTDSHACFLPGSDLPVDVPVAPQLVYRRADKHAICSCRCDGPGPGPFCACPSGTQCRPVVREIGVPGGEDFEGSYCIPTGTEYDPANPPPADFCRAVDMNCGDPRPY
jgi:hypothetical protein